MLEYILRLFIMVPIIGAMAWGSLWLWKKAQSGMTLGASSGTPDRALSIIDATPIGVGSKLVVVRYRDRELVLAVNRAQTLLIAEASDA